MSQESAKTSVTNELARERNRLASDRTLMAWIRTSISLIGFGFAIAKSYDYLEADYADKTGRILDAVHTPIIFGTSFIVLGMIGILAGIIQYGRMLNRIKIEQYTYSEPWPLPKIIAIILLIIGLFGLIAILL